MTNEPYRQKKVTKTSTSLTHPTHSLTSVHSSLTLLSTARTTTRKKKKKKKKKKSLIYTPKPNHEITNE